MQRKMKHANDDQKYLKKGKNTPADESNAEQNS